MKSGLFWLLASGLLVLSCKPHVSGLLPQTPPPAALVLPTGAPIELPRPDAVAPQDYAGLRNVVAYTPGLISGSVPEGEAGFATLRRMGIKTIISVDGELPDVETARAHGLRYVHLPIGYNGMDHARTLEIARAVHDLPGPIYLHCHHGKHRSAAAAAASAVTLGELTDEEAVARMHVSGTAPNYVGLFQCVDAARLATPQELAAASNAFPEIFKTSGIVQAMVQVTNAVSQLSAIEKAGWKTPVDHPDLVPAAEAGRLADLLRVLHNDREVIARSDAFRQLLLTESQHAQALEDGIVKGESPALLSEKFKVVQQACTQCHATYRDPNVFKD